MDSLSYHTSGCRVAGEGWKLIIVGIELCFLATPQLVEVPTLHHRGKKVMPAGSYDGSWVGVIGEVDYCDPFIEKNRPIGRKGPAR